MDIGEARGSASWRSVNGLAAIGFGAVAGFFLFTEHHADLFGLLPVLLLFCSPVMLLFMHLGHDPQGQSAHFRGAST